MNVLIVEDNATDSGLVRVLFEMSGHQVQIVSSAEAAVTAIAVKSPDVLLVDLNLPGISGTHLVRILRADIRVPPIPILAVSAYPEILSRTDQIVAGCDAFIAKPFNTRTLVNQVEQLTRAKSCAG
jgi:DNA-binding response OmpR family regulator